MTPVPPRCDIFCRIVDNFGDIGVAWRLARQLTTEKKFLVRLIVDDLASFARIAPAIVTDRPEQVVDAVTVLHWRADESGMPEYEGVADLVIEAFACHVPPDYLKAMPARRSPPVWVNLEYLSAENWVASHHLQPSPHPSLPLTKYFFFPGFDTGTGGLIRETGLPAAQDSVEWRSTAEVQRIFIFGYAGAPLGAWLDAVGDQGKPAAVTIAGNSLATEFERWGGLQAENGCGVAPIIEIQKADFVPQPAFDALLREHDILFVRGEDSFVRAIWAAKPFVWQIYPQSDGAHWPKLNAFLDRYCCGLDSKSAAALRELWRAWNAADVGAIVPAWRGYCGALPALRTHALAWTRQLEKLPDLASNLLSFYRKIAKM